MGDERRARRIRVLTVSSGIDEERYGTRLKNSGPRMVPRATRVQEGERVECSLTTDAIMNYEPLVIFKLRGSFESETLGHEETGRSVAGLKRCRVVQIRKWA